jgi:hypothetical protein
MKKGTRKATIKPVDAEPLRRAMVEALVNTIDPEIIFMELVDDFFDEELASVSEVSVQLERGKFTALLGGYGTSLKSLPLNFPMSGRDIEYVVSMTDLEPSDLVALDEAIACLSKWRQMVKVALEREQR